MHRIQRSALEVKNPIRRPLLRFWSRDGEAEIRLLNVTPVDWDRPRSLAAAGP